jgi:UDP-3-O-[3-hydroxymyristoyl] N-acetylglucosamine deacetylase
MASETQMQIPRRTIAREAELSGLGVRSGLEIEVLLGPAEPGTGIIFERSDLGRDWPADLAHALPLPACSSIGDDDGRVDFVEHVMAVLWAAQVTDIRVRINGPEIPLLDGSAAPLWETICEAGTQFLDGVVEYLQPDEPLFNIGDSRALVVLPSSAPRFAYSLVHPHRLIGHQHAEFDPSAGDFGDDIAPARTFATTDELEQLQAAGMIAAGSEENCLVVGDNGYSAEPFAANAMARHKILDLIGDLYLLGMPLCAHVIGYRTGHADNRALAQMIASACDG